MELTYFFWRLLLASSALKERMAQRQKAFPHGIGFSDQNGSSIRYTFPSLRMQSFGVMESTTASHIRYGRCLAFSSKSRQCPIAYIFIATNWKNVCATSAALLFSITRPAAAVSFSLCCSSFASLRDKSSSSISSAIVGTFNKYGPASRQTKSEGSNGASVFLATRGSSLRICNRQISLFIFNLLSPLKLVKAHAHSNAFSKSITALCAD